MLWLLSPERLREMTFLRSKKEGSQEAKGKVATAEVALSLFQGRA